MYRPQSRSREEGPGGRAARGVRGKGGLRRPHPEHPRVALADARKALHDLNVIAVKADYTLILGHSDRECARYLESARQPWDGRRDAEYSFPSKESRLRD